MAAYNAEKTISQAITSVIDQTYNNWELLVIDDCSTDATLSYIMEFVDKDKRVRLIKNKVNCGVSKTRYYGLEASKGEWIAILDSDDAWKPDKLEKQIRRQKEKNAELLFTGSAFMHENGDLIDWYLHTPDEIGYRMLLKQNLVSNSSVLVKKQLYRNYYSTGDNMHEDFATWLRILKAGLNAYGIDEPLIIYRLSSKSKSGNKVKASIMNWNTYRFIGLNFFEAFYYEFWYVVKGLLKYKNLK